MTKTAACALILACFLPAAPATSAEKKKPVLVFLLGGQSNMAGVGKIAELKPPHSEPVPNVKIWRGRKWAPLVSKDGKRGKCGPEIGFAHAIAKVHPDADIRLVKYAASGTALHDDWAPTEGPQYMRFVKTAKAALADLDAAKVNYKIAGMLWLQGESDAAEKKGDVYEKNLTAFIAHMREKFKAPKMPFIIARVLTYYGGRTGQAKIVRDAQVRIAESDDQAAWFDTDDCELFNKGHYNTAGLIKIGKRFAAKYKEIAEASKVKPKAKAKAKPD